MDTIRETIANTFQVPVESISDESSSESVSGWDSMGHLNLVMALEQRLRLSFTLPEILQMKDVRSIRQVVDAKNPGGAP